MRLRLAITLLLVVAATCRPPDLTASGGCIPWSEGPSATRVAATTPDAADAGDAEPDAAGDAGAPAPPSAASLPPLRIRLAVRPGAAEAADPVGREDVFFSQLAAGLAARPSFEPDPDVESLAERLARAAARRREDATLSATRAAGLEPFLVVHVGLLRPAAGAAVTEPTYVVGLTLVAERTPERTALDVPPAVSWQLDLPARAVRSARLVGTVAQAIEARAQVELDRLISVGRETLADPLLPQRPAVAEARLLALGRLAYPDLVDTLGTDRPDARHLAARLLARAADPDLIPVYGRMLADDDADVRLAAVDGLWRAARGRPPALADDPDGVPPPERAWLVPFGDTACRFAAGDDAAAPPPDAPRAALAERLDAVHDVLDDPDGRVARAALVLLAEVRAGESVRALHAALRGTEDASTRELLTVALGRFGERSVAARLREIATGDGELSQAAAVTLGRLGERGADRVLLRLAASGEPLERCAAAEALAGSRDDDVPPALVPLLAGDEPPPVARAARVALVAIGEPAIPVLAEALDHADPTVAWAAAEAMGEIGSPEALEPLTARLVGLDAVLRDYIVEALGRIGDVRALPALVAAFGGSPAYRNEAPILRAILSFGRLAVGALVDGLATEDAGIRAGAIEALNRLGDTEHVARVLPLLQDADATVRARAADYLAAAKDDRAVGDLAAQIEDADEDAAAAAAAALGEVGGETARQTLEHALGDERSVVALAAARALARIGDPESVRPVLDAAARMSAYDRARMVEALVAFGGAARPALVEALGGDRLRPAALEALDGLGAVVDPTVLARHRGDQRVAVRELVARMLGRAGGAAAIEPLQALLRDPAAAVREAAVGAVTEIGGPEAATLLRSALADEQDEWVARAIRRALLHLGSVP